jgi:hypothetical protein
MVGALQYRNGKSTVNKKNLNSGMERLLPLRLERKNTRNLQGLLGVKNVTRWN